MRRTKIKTDNVEQLMEIVRSLQRGEEPTQESIRESAERVSKAGAPMSDEPKEDVSPRIPKNSDARMRAKQNDAEDDIEETEAEPKKRTGTKARETDKTTDQETEPAAPSRSGQEKAKEGEPESQSESARPGVSRPWGGILPKGKGTRYPEHLSRNAGHGASRSGLLRRDSILRELEDDDEDSRKGLSVDPESRNVFERIAGEDGGNAGDAKKQRDATNEPVRPDQDTEKKAANNDRTNPDDGSDTAGTEDSSSDAPDPGTTQEDDASIKITNAKKRWRKTAAEKEEEIRKGFAPQKRTAADVLQAAREYVQDWLEALKDKGISRREMMMIGAAALFVVLLVVLIFQAVSGSIASRRKSEHVTADAGLHITVEDEPENWCSSYPVKLKLSVTDATVQSVQINGENYTPDASGLVTVEANTDLLEVEVATAQETRSARIEIPKLDGEPPVVHATLQNDRIELTAADARSSVRALYYAVGTETEPDLVPQYQKYTEPISYTEGMLYCFYAEDAAGNRSTPTVTNMKTAESLTISADMIAMYPGETAALAVKAEPEYALLENLSYESQNPDLLSVSAGGVITALANGTGAVKVTADGVSAAICTVEVSDSRTVTISAVGDCTLGTDENFNAATSFNAYEAMNGTSYFFQNVRSILAADDATFANFEGTLTTETTREPKEYAFKGDPSYAQILTDGSVDVVTLANNHSSDYGAKSLTDTEDALDAAGIDYCIGDKAAVKDVGGIPTAFIGIYVLNDGMAREEQVKQTIAAAHQQGAKLVIVAFHWGTEKATEPDETQKSLAHTAIDCGADLVVGHHPHVLQAIEYYKGKYIAYSLGNFCFGGNSAPSDMDTMIFQQTFTVEKGEVQTDAAATVVPCSISSAAGYNDYQPTPVEGDASIAIIDRLNTMSASYGVTVNSDGTVVVSGAQNE